MYLHDDPAASKGGECYIRTAQKAVSNRLRYSGCDDRPVLKRGSASVVAMKDGGVGVVFRPCGGAPRVEIVYTRTTRHTVKANPLQRAEALAALDALTDNACVRAVNFTLEAYRTRLLSERDTLCFVLADAIARQGEGSVLDILVKATSLAGRRAANASESFLAAAE
jgi:hypothetical protein